MGTRENRFGAANARMKYPIFGAAPCAHFNIVSKQGAASLRLGFLERDEYTIFRERQHSCQLILILDFFVIFDHYF